MNSIDLLVSKSNVHPQWQALLIDALSYVDTSYLQELIDKPNWLPGIDNLFAAFRRDINSIHYILVGESPYPRPGSANGIAFYDAAVGDLWSGTGLSKAVNRATSMRNILKTALLAEGLLTADNNGKISQQDIARIDKTVLIQSMDELFVNLHHRGFLLLNATPVLQPDRKPAKEAIYWHTFLQQILTLLAEKLDQPATLILWGKIAENIEALPASQRYRKLKCEHPYNISFIHNPTMQTLFAELKILSRKT